MTIHFLLSEYFNWPMITIQCLFNHSMADIIQAGQHICQKKKKSFDDENILVIILYSEKKNVWYCSLLVK